MIGRTTDVNSSNRVYAQCFCSGKCRHSSIKNDYCSGKPGLSLPPLILTPQFNQSGQLSDSQVGCRTNSKMYDDFLFIHSVNYLSLIHI